MTTERGRDIRWHVQQAMIARRPRLRTAHTLARQLQADGVDSEAFMQALGFHYPLPGWGSAATLVLSKLMTWDRLQAHNARPTLARPYGRMRLLAVQPGPALDVLLDADHPDRATRRARFRLREGYFR